MDGVNEMAAGGSARSLHAQSAGIHAAWEVSANSIYAFAVHAALQMDEYVTRSSAWSASLSSGHYYERSLRAGGAVVQKGSDSRRLEQRTQDTFRSRTKRAGSTNAAARERFRPVIVFAAAEPRGSHTMPAPLSGRPVCRERVARISLAPQPGQSVEAERTSTTCVPQRGPWPVRLIRLVQSAVPEYLERAPCD